MKDRCEAQVILGGHVFSCMREDGHVHDEDVQVQVHRAGYGGKGTWWPHGTKHEQVVTVMIEWIDSKRCPDSGTCHHRCVGGCFRVENAGPLSIAGYKNDEWPEIVKDHAGQPKRSRL